MVIVKISCDVLQQSICYVLLKLASYSFGNIFGIYSCDIIQLTTQSKLIHVNDHL